MQAQAGCTEYNAVRRPSIASSIFGVSIFKGLLSIPCDGRGARRPLGQSFHESVGHARASIDARLYQNETNKILFMLFDLD